MTDSEKHPLALIIEDDEKLSTIFAQAMKMAGFETQTVRDGLEAMSVLDSIVPAVVTLDIHVPNVSGDKILQKIRSTETLKNTRVIITTADPLTADMLHDSADFVLQKPVSFSQLRDLASRLQESD
jgi:DNA-binding response OmpR family regulator